MVMMHLTMARSRLPLHKIAILCLSILLMVAPECHAADYAVVFVYRRFGEPHHPSINTPVSAFKAQPDYLATHGFHVWSLPRLVRTLQAGKPVPEKTVALSVDDAFQSVYDEAWPLLRAHHFPLTIFVSTQAVDRHYPAYMSWSEMRTMQAQGVTFSDHTVTHPHPPEIGWHLLLVYPSLVQDALNQAVAATFQRIRNQVFFAALIGFYENA